MSNDITIIVSIVLFMMLIGAAIPLINDSFSSSYTTDVNGTILYNAASNRISSDIDCQDWYKAKFIDKFGIPFGSQVAGALNYGAPIENLTVNNTGLWGMFENLYGTVANFFSGFYNTGLYAGGYNESEYTLMNLTAAQAEALDLEPCPTATYGSRLSVWKILGSMFTSIFWTFGVADWINIFIFLPLRLLLLLLIARNIWVGGGG